MELKNHHVSLFFWNRTHYNFFNFPVFIDLLSYKPQYPPAVRKKQVLKQQIGIFFNYRHIFLKYPVLGI